jgi:hypothetical protein
MPPAFQPDPTKPNYYVGPDASLPAIGRALGIIPQQIDPSAPGGSLDTSESDAERARMQQLLSQLQQQATSGDGAWRDSLNKAIANAQAGASALGQSEALQARSGYAGTLRNIANAQGAAAQRGVAEGNMLRTESENNAQDELAQLQPAMGAGDINQAAQSAAVQQANRAENAALVQQAQQSTGQLINGIASAVHISMGGQVPGQPEVFGDDERNDVVPAMLSPGEIVVPRSKASDTR